MHSSINQKFNELSDTACAEKWTLSSDPLYQSSGSVLYLIFLKFAYPASLNILFVREWWQVKVSLEICPQIFSII